MKLISEFCIEAYTALTQFCLSFHEPRVEIVNSAQWQADNHQPVLLSSFQSATPYPNN